MSRSGSTPQVQAARSRAAGTRHASVLAPEWRCVNVLDEYRLKATGREQVDLGAGQWPGRSLDRPVLLAACRCDDDQRPTGSDQALDASDRLSPGLVGERLHREAFDYKVECLSRRQYELDVLARRLASARPLRRLVSGPSPLARLTSVLLGLKARRCRTPDSVSAAARVAPACAQRDSGRVPASFDRGTVMFARVRHVPRR